MFHQNSVRSQQKTVNAGDVMLERNAEDVLASEAAAQQRTFLFFSKVSRQNSNRAYC